MTTAARAGERPLRVMVCPHELVMGGSQLNAIDLAATLRDRGHDVEVFAPRGPLAERIAEKRLPFVEAPARRPGFDLRSARALTAEMRRFRPDVVHAFESYPTVSASLAALRQPHRLVVTVMSMSVPDHLPRLVPLTAGTGELVDGAAHRPGPTLLLEPPIDADADAPGDVEAAREALGVARDALVVSVVGRLSAEHEKAKGIVAAIDELIATPGAPALTLLIAGAGDEEEAVQGAAARARAAGAQLDVRLLGNVPDPRPVYDAADIVFGMGSSALRAMAHAKPLIVQGREGFWELLTPQSLPSFFRDGFFGRGPSGGPGFAQLVATLAGDAARRSELGAFGREVVLERYAMTRAAERLEAVYRDELGTERSRGRVLRDRLGSLARFAKFRVAMRVPAAQRTVRMLTGRHG